MRQLEAGRRALVQLCIKITPPQPHLTRAWFKADSHFGVTCASFRRV